MGRNINLKSVTHKEKTAALICNIIQFMVAEPLNVPDMRLELVYDISEMDAAGNKRFQYVVGTNSFFIYLSSMIKKNSHDSIINSVSSQLASLASENKNIKSELASSNLIFILNIENFKFSLDFLIHILSLSENKLKYPDILFEFCDLFIFSEKSHHFLNLSEISFISLF